MEPVVEHVGASDEERGEVILDPPLNEAPPRVRVNPSKYWCCTIFNMFTDDVLMDLEQGTQYIIGTEMCPTTNKMHLQCYFEFPKRVRPLEKYKNWKAHWSRAKGDRKANIKYCSKDGMFVTNFDKVYTINDDAELSVHITEVWNKTIKEEKIKKDQIEWRKWKCVIYEIYKCMYITKVMKVIKSRKAYKEYEQHIYNLTFPGEEGWKEEPEPPKPKINTSFLKL